MLLRTSERRPMSKRKQGGVRRVKRSPQKHPTVREYGGVIFRIVGHQRPSNELFWAKIERFHVHNGNQQEIIKRYFECVQV